MNIVHQKALPALILICCFVGCRHAIPTRTAFTDSRQVRIEEYILRDLIERLSPESDTVVVEGSALAMEKLRSTKWTKPRQLLSVRDAYYGRNSTVIAKQSGKRCPLVYVGKVYVNTFPDFLYEALQVERSQANCVGVGVIYHSNIGEASFYYFFQEVNGEIRFVKRVAGLMS